MRAKGLAAFAQGAMRWFRGCAMWQLRLATFAAGALSVLALAPFFVWPVLWLTMPVLLWAAEAEADREAGTMSAARVAIWRRWPLGRAAEAGWWWGFGFFFAGLTWVGEAFLVEAEIFAWLLPFAVTLLPAGLALFMAFAIIIAFMLVETTERRVIALAVALGMTEWLRGHILSGFPWNVLGYALTYPLPLMQWASLLGIYGLTIVTGVAFLAPAVLISRAHASIFPARRSYALAGGAILLPLVMLAMGSVWRSLALAAYEAPVSIETSPMVRIVQPSVLQRDKWRPEHQRRIFEEHLDLSLRNGHGAVDEAAGIALIVWPEAAMPFRPLDTPAALSAIGRMLPAGVVLVSGALRVDEADIRRGVGRKVFNSLLAFGDDGTVVATYDKSHLVPFGEYLPAQNLLEAIGLQQLSKLRGGFASGPEPRPRLLLGRLGVFAPLICYEAIFPDLQIGPGERPRALLNVTNDGWFGNSIGPRQHLHQARVRAVESGLPLIRAANNGISAIIDPYGRTIAQLDLNIRGSVDARLPGAIAPPFYHRAGDALFFTLVFALLAWLLLTHAWSRPTDPY